MEILKEVKKALATVSLLVFLLLPSSTEAQAIQLTASERASLAQQIDLLLKQIALLQTQVDQLAALSEVGAGQITKHVTVIDTYPAYLIPTLANSNHRQYFQTVFNILPDQYDAQISHVLVYGGEASFDAYVETVPPRHSSWLYGAHTDVVSEREPDVELIVHELAHMIAYEELIGVPKPAIANCHEYFANSNCPAVSSYLGQFVSTFWSVGDLDRVASYDNWEDQLEAGYEYYDRHPNDFVSYYAAVSPEEDFAESLMFYLTDSTVGRYTYANDKIQFFDQFEELQQTRKEILEQFYSTASGPR